MRFNYFEFWYGTRVAAGDHLGVSKHANIPYREGRWDGQDERPGNSNRSGRWEAAFGGRE